MVALHICEYVFEFIIETCQISKIFALVCEYMTGHKRLKNIWIEGIIQDYSAITFVDDLLPNSNRSKKKKQSVTYSGIHLSINDIIFITHQNQIKPIASDIDRFFKRRYSLFSLYDNGILLDKESWYSVTPECIAQHHALRLQCDVVLDAFCGAGGNSIQLAMTCHRVIALDIDPLKISMAKHNASIYGVSDRIEFICGDYFKILPTLRSLVIDAIFLSPPWGGLNYMKQDEQSATFYAFDRMMNVGGNAIMTLAASITSNIAFYVPKQTSIECLQKCSSFTCMPDRCDIEESYVGKHLTALTAYYGELANICE